MSQAVSFIPAPRIISSRCQRRRVMWVFVNVFAVSVVLIAAVVARSLLLGDDYRSASTTEIAQERLESIVTEQIEQATALRLVDSRRQAHAEATEHPDWSVLLGYISSIGAEKTVLERFLLEPGDAKGRFEVNLKGQAVSQYAVTEFVLGLERSGVFSQTRLLRSNRSGDRGFAFDIECKIGEPTGSDPTVEVKQE